MTGKELWNIFIRENNLHEIANDYEAWAFGADADELAHLVAIGTKTATSSAYPLYELKNEPLPLSGVYSVILDSKGNAVCVIKTTKVEVVTFNEVTAEHAYKEGEGDRSLARWREVHEKFFTKALGKVGLQFTPDMKVVCEEFTLVYKQS
jgi:uncharacterized protein YhfF